MRPSAAISVEVGAIDEDVRRDDQIEARIGADAGGRGLRSGRRLELVIKILAPRLSTMPGDRSTPSSSPPTAGTRAPDKSGAAAEIEHGARNAHGRFASRQTSATARSQQLRRAYRTSADQRIVELRRVLVEHRAHIIRRHRVPADVAASRSRSPRRGGPADRRPAPARTPSIAPSRSPALSRRSPRANQAAAKPGASSTVCSSRSIAAAAIAPRPGTRAPCRSAGRRSGRRRTETASGCAALKPFARDLSVADAYLAHDASRRPASADALRRLLQARRLLHRPDPAGRQGR